VSQFDETEGAQPGECDDPTGFVPGLPAHRSYEGSGLIAEMREVSYRKKGKKKGKVIVFDFDETITKSPKRMAHIAKCLKECGDTIWIVTGNESDRSELIDRLENEYDFPFDGLIQYKDDETDGLQRREVLKELDAWLAFDDRMGRAPVLTKVCPHLFLTAKPTKDQEKALEDAKNAKKIVKQAEDENDV